jgi:nucleoredoxin
MKPTFIKKILVISSLSLVAFAFQLQADLTKLLPEELRTASNQKIQRDALAGKIVGIYFSASWCPPCRNFTPSLVNMRDAHKDAFEVILVGFDRGDAAHWKYMKDYKMNFLSLVPGGPESQSLAQRFGVKGIPHLAIIAPDGSVLSQNAVGEVAADSKAAMERWKTRAGL